MVAATRDFLYMGLTELIQWQAPPILILICLCLSWTDNVSQDVESWAVKGCHMSVFMCYCVSLVVVICVVVKADCLR